MRKAVAASNIRLDSLFDDNYHPAIAVLLQVRARETTSLPRALTFWKEGREGRFNQPTSTRINQRPPWTLTC
jgi:hypothetical protein